MNFLYYSLQAGAGLFLMYAFYRAFLVRLTFYKANRLYLAGYTLLSLLAPLLDTSGLWPHPVETSILFVRTDPVAPSAVTAGVTGVAGAAPVHTLSLTQVLLYSLVTGVVIMLIRLAIQVLSLIRLRRKAVLLSDTPGRGIKVYAVPYPMAPFSFGRSIFIHLSAREMPDFRRILDHEQAHIRQHHTLDILLTQVVLLLQWWNPIAWMLNRSIRQNLEFLADQSVIDQGVDPRQYQYLLLRVSGISVPALSNPFNFSPLKNRIAMMNKQRSGRRQIVRFLFALPLLVLLLVAASRHQAPPVAGMDAYHVAGFVLDATTLKAVAGATVKDDVSGLSTTSDDKGFFTLDFPVAGRTDTLHVNVYVKKAGYADGFCFFSAPLTTPEGKKREWGGDLECIGITTGQDAHPGFSNSRALTPEEAEDLVAGHSPAREEAYTKFVKDIASSRGAEAAFAAAPEQIYFLINGNAYIAFGKGYTSMEGPVDVVLVNGKRMTGAEVNKTYTRSQLIHGGQALSAQFAKKQYGIDEDLFVIHTKAQP